MRVKILKKMKSLQDELFKACSGFSSARTGDILGRRALGWRGTPGPKHAQVLGSGGMGNSP